MQITCHGAAGFVTGSCHLVETGSARFLIDCGMYQGNKALNRLNYEPFGFDPQTVDFVINTHGHIDHCGLLPKLVKYGFTGTIYASASHPGEEPAGVALISEITKDSTLPVLAIGGVTADNVEEVIKAGAAGVAVISAIAGAEDVKAAAEAMSNALKTAWAGLSAAEVKVSA